MQHLEDYWEAAKKYIDGVKQEKDVIGVIVAGSLVYGHMHKNSDVDIFVILNKRCDYRERGNTWVNGIEIEYFKNPPQQIRAYFVTEKESPHTAHMLANGQVMYKDSVVVDNLIKEAAEILQAPVVALSAIQSELFKYSYDDIFKDWEDALDHKDNLAATILKNKIIDKSINIFCKVHQVRRVKDKDLENQFSPISTEFVDLLSQSISAPVRHMPTLEKLRDYTEALLGGRRSNEWILKSPLDL